MNSSSRNQFPLHCALVMLMAQAAVAAPTEPEKVEISAKEGRTIEPKTDQIEYTIKDKDAKGYARTKFDFHPIDSQKQNFTKNPGRKNADGDYDPIVSPSAFTHNYSKQELHFTTGSAAYDLSIKRTPVPGKKDKVTLEASVTQTLNPGPNNGETVSIESTVRDPFVFSDTYPDAHFGLYSGGLDYSFSLLDDTAFPETFAPDLDSFGAVADETSMMFTARVAPGILEEPDDFWADGVPGAIDLYTLTLSSDIDHNVAVDLVFGESTADFTLDYLAASVPFDPFDAGELALLEADIAAAFVDGVLVGALEDLFSVGIVHSQALTDFTLGGADAVVLTAVEVPLPASSSALMGLGLFASICRRRRAS